MGFIGQLTVMDTLLNSGDILNSRYRVLHQLGHGGFGRTYLAEDINRFDEHCVLKEFAPQIECSFIHEKAQELFEREAGVLYRLQHPQIPKFRELFRFRHREKEHFLLVQDYVEGQTYHTLLNDRIEQGQRFSEAEVIQLLNQLLPVLEYIHSMGVIHRDISPENLILHSRSRLPMLIDFGSIKEKKSQSQSIEAMPYTETLSMMGTVIGKSGYAPPEQIERGIVFAHSDLYALAATAVVLLTGKKAQTLIDLDSYHWNWQQEVTVTPELASVLTTMLSPNTGDRFNSATEVIKNLEAVSLSTSDPAKLVAAPIVVHQSDQQSLMPLTSKIQTLPNLGLAIATIIIMLLMSLGGFWWSKSRDSTTVSSTDTSLSDPNNFTQIENRLDWRFSQGEKIIIPQMTTFKKELAVVAFAEGNYDRAASLLSESLKIFANDPEALIYLNNAQIGLKKSYSIAVSVPIGSNINAAKEILRGVAQAQNKLNQKGGFDGIPLKIQIVNDDNNPKIARQVATSLSRNPKILGVIGHYASDVTLATAKIYQSNQLVMISPVSTSVELSNLSPYLFRTVPSDYIAARALAEYMLKKLDRENVAIFYNSQSNYSKSLKSEFIAAVSLGGGRVVNTFDLSDANFSATDTFSQAIDGKAEVIMLAASNDTLDRALQVIQVNHNRLHLLGGDDVYTLKTLQIAGELAEDMVLAIPWHTKSEPNAEFNQVSQKLWGGEVNWRTAMAYDATKALITAIKSSSQPTRIGIQKTLSDPHFIASGANNQINFLPSGDRPKQIELVKVYESQNVSFDYIFMPILEEEKLDLLF